MKLQHPCDPQTLEQFLCGTLPARQAQEFTDHLNVCASCGEALEAQAAEHSVWSEASALLGDHKFGDQGRLSGQSSHDAPFQQVLSRLAPTDDPDSMGRIGGYEVTGVIGSGGMGVVLKAYDRSLDRVVAVKVMAPHLAASGSARQRFAREAKAAAAVLHPNVIAIHGVSNEQALPYLVMLYVRGESLQKRIDEVGPLPLVDILRIGTQVAAGLAAAHEQGLVHRDIKPGNILMEQGVERVTITDFGLARAVDDASMTRSGVIAGTPQYMSPEQARGVPIDARSDLFSLGSLLYAMCTGHSPFRAETSFGVIHRITHDDPRPITEINPDIPLWLECVVIKLLSKRASERFQSAAEVAELLASCLSHAQYPASTPLPEAVLELSARKMKRPRRLKFLSAACLLPMLILAGVFIVLEWNRGTLRIESEADDVPIRVLQGDQVVQDLIVSKSGKTVRIAAGNYEVEIGERMDGMLIEDGEVTLHRGGENVVRIMSVATEVDGADSPEERLEYPEEESFGISLSTRVYDVSEFVDFNLSISRETQFNTLIGLLQQFVKHAASIDYWPSFDNVVVRGPDSTHDEITNTLKQLRLCKQQIRGMMSLNAEIERLQAELSEIPDSERTSQRSKVLQQKINVAMVTRSEQMRVFEFTLAKLRAEQTKTASVDGQNIQQVASPDYERTNEEDNADPFHIGAILKAADARRIPTYFAYGFEVTKVVPDSPAQRAGIEVGDVLLAWEGNHFYSKVPGPKLLVSAAATRELRQAVERVQQVQQAPTADDHFTMKFAVLDHRSGEVVEVSTAWGLANGSNKDHGLRVIRERKNERR